jgi:hypothetical protein
MYNAANSGLVIAAEKLIPLLPEAIQAEARKALDENDNEAMESLLEDLPAESNLTSFDSVFVYDGEEPNDSLEEGVMYVMWDANENPFYTRVLTPEAQVLKEKNLLPEFAQWVTFG